MLQNQKRRHQIFRLALFGFFLVCFLNRANQPPLADEVVFFKPLEAWLRTGPQRWGVWHTPLYPWVLYLLTLVFGLKPLVIRTVGLFCVTGALGLILKSAEIIADRMKRPLDEEDRTLLWALLLLQPLCLGSALLVDYDNTFLLLGTAWYFYLLVKEERRFTVLGAALGFCLLGKETTPLIYPLGIWIASGSFGLAFVSALVGAVIYGALSFAWCWAYGIPFHSIFEMGLLGLNTAGAINGAQKGMEFKRSLWIKISPIFWVSLPLALLLGIRLRKFKTLGRECWALLAVIVGAVLVYTFPLKQMTYHFPKYMSPLLIWLPLFGFLLIAKVKDSTRFWWVLPISFWGLCPDLFWVLHERNLESVVQSFVVAVLGLGFIYVFFRVQKKTQISFEMILLMSGLGVGINYSKMALTTPQALTYWYGDLGIVDAQRYVSQHPGVEILSPAEDLAYATSNLGVKYASLADLTAHSGQICKPTRPLAIITRAREATSLLTAPENESFRKCLKVVQITADLVAGESH